MPVATIDLSKGWLPDIPPFEMPNGGLTDTNQILPSTLGYRGLGADTYIDTAISTPNPPCGITVRKGTFYIGTSDKLYRYVTDATNTKLNNYHAGPAYSNKWEFVWWGSWLIASNGYDAIQILKDTATGTFDNLTGAPPAAKHICLLDNRLILGNLGLALSLGTTDTNVASSNFDYKLSGIIYNKTAVTAGTALAAGTIQQNKYGIYRFTINSAGTITCTAGAANFTTGYNTEALAIAALPAVPANNAQMGYITVMSTNAAGFVGATDALKGGSSGNPAAFTNYHIDCEYRSEKKLFWCGLDDPEDWTPSVTTGCGYQDIPDLEEEITNLVTVPNGFLILGSENIFIGYTVPNNYVFNFKIIDKNVGAKKYTAVAANNGAYFWSERNIWFFNGSRALPIGEGLRNTVMIPMGLTVSYLPTDVQGGQGGDGTTYYFDVCHDFEENNIFWNYKFTSGSSYKSHIIVYNYKTDQWTYYLGFTSSLDTGGYCCGIVYDHYTNTKITPIIFKYISSPAAKIYYTWLSAVSTSGDLTTGEIALRADDGEMKTIMITGVRPRISGYSTTVTVTVSSRLNEDDTPATTTGTILTTSSSGWADLRATGRYHKIKTTLSGGVIKSIDVKYQMAGAR